MKQADFQVLEDGVPQQVVSFESVSVSPEPAAKPSRRPTISVNQKVEDRTARTFVVVFDDIQMDRFQSTRAKKAVAQFLTKGVREGDRVSLFATSGSAWSEARGWRPAATS